MNQRIISIATILTAILCTTLLAAPRTLTVNVDKPGAKIGPLFYGLMTEEINHSYDGGLYAELIQNRIFQDKSDAPAHWTAITGADSTATIAMDEANPVNDIALKRSLRVDITGIGNGQRAGVANDGYWGIPVWPNTKYHVSFYARASEGFTGPLTVDIESNDGATMFATASVPAIDTKWKKYDVDLTTADVPKSTANRFVISAGSKGSIWLSLVSLFPPTYHNRPNGNRVDLMEKLAGLHPAFLRFPGGNFLEGDRVVDHFEWKKTIGPLEDRPGHNGCWRYHASDGLGLLEFLEWCEDLHMEPLLAVYAGFSLTGEHVNPGPDLAPFVQEALDEIEYCTGDASTTWGQRRIKDGHPDAFVIHYIEIGNEDFFDKSRTYDGRFAQVYDAIKAKYPNLQCIATAPVHSRTPDLYDDHGYPSAGGMLKMVHRYDKRDATEPKVFFGEWATEDGKPTPTMRAALADAAWLTGLQHDADTVLMNCYAPLLVNVNKGAWQWPTNLIGYDAANSFGSPSYYAQAMFSGNWGDTALSSELSAPVQDNATRPDPKGYVGIGTWKTTAQFKDVKVTGGTDSLLQSDFSSKLDPWKPAGGKWAAKDGVAEQTDKAREDARLTTGNVNWQDYIFTAKARKTGGSEGFLVLFHVRDRDNYCWFNAGGWNNEKAAIEQCSDGDKQQIGTSSPCKIEDGKWYDLRVEVHGRDIKCFVDDKLMAQGTEGSGTPPQSLYVAASKVDSSGDVILKIVNNGGEPAPLEIKLNGVSDVAKSATMQQLTGQPGDQNSVHEPMKVSPKDVHIDDAGTDFTREFPAYSVSVIRLKTK